MIRGTMIYLLCVVAALYALLALLYQLLRHGYTPRAEQIAIALDQSANAASNGWADETLSSRAWREEQTSAKWLRIRGAINKLFGDANHCRDAYLAELKRAQLPSDLRAAVGDRYDHPA